MKLQVIKRNGRFYFHVYLPKNIVEHVLKWERGEQLIFSIIDDGLILHKKNTPDFRNDDWSKDLECNNCNIPTIFIKGLIRKNELIFISRCHQCKKPKKIILPMDEKENWLKNVEDMIERCDICNKKTLERKRVKFGWDGKSTNYVTIVYYCSNCERERTKIIPYKLISSYMEISPKKIDLPIIKCVFCNKEINNYEDLTCPHCNNIIKCEKCGNLIIERSRYCIHCGSELKEFIDELELETQCCPFCDETINQGALFCERCGNLVTCIACGAPIKESTNYCGTCGTNIKKDISLGDLIEK